MLFWKNLYDVGSFVENLYTKNLYDVGFKNMYGAHTYFFLSTLTYRIKKARNYKTTD